MELYDLIEVEWIDAQTETGWEDLEDHTLNEKELHVRSVGYMLYNTPVCIVLAQTIDLTENPSFNGTITIPKVSILQKKKLVSAAIPSA